MTAGDAEESWPSGRQLRKLTRTATEAHTGGHMGELVSEVYSVLFSGAIAVVMVLGAVQGLNASLHPGPEAATVDPSWLALIVGLVVAGAVIGLSGRLGPVGMGGAQALWWLTTPADRRSLLRPRLMVLPLIGALVGLVGGLLVGFLAFGEFGPNLLWITVDFVLASAVMVVAVAAGQVRAGAGATGRLRPAVLLGDVLTAAGPLAALALVLLRPEPIAVDWVHLGPMIAAVLGVLLVAGMWWLDRGLEQISGRELRARGSVASYASGAVTSMDTRELGRALNVNTARDARRRSAPMLGARGPVTAILVGDATVLARTPRHLIQIAVGMCVALLGLAAGWPVVTNVVLLLAGGILTAMATGEGSRRAEMAPVLDRHFPIAGTEVRRARVLLPLVVMVPWTLVVLGLWGWVHGELLGFLLLGLVTGPVFAAGVLRAAYRKPPDWSKPLVPGPFGPMAPGVIAAFARGPDIVVLCSVPMIVAVVALGVSPIVLAVQLGTSLIALAIATRAPKDGSKGWMQRMSEQAESQREEMQRQRGGRR